ncbi:MAG: hypothetical protein CMP47_03555 [Rickettsiales bacterium]|jgi:hypothetical protein|nr:hypothetical protein [Rickettsiales bacterium]
MGVTWVLERLISLIPTIDKVSKDKREVADNALRSISHALTETCIYVNQYTKHDKCDTEIEAQLSRYWSAAAIPLRHLDLELSKICEYKSEYWLDPSSWTGKNTRGIAIDLESVREKYRAKLI